VSLINLPSRAKELPFHMLNTASDLDADLSDLYLYNPFYKTKNAGNRATSHVKY